jgi:membrane protease YdiL (CAAX protease family)
MTTSAASLPQPAGGSGSLRAPLLGVLAAIAITTSMDASGLSDFSALPLLPLMALFWWLQRLSRREVGFTWGKPVHYAWAIAYPALVLPVGAAIAYAAGGVDTSAMDVRKTLTNFAVMTLATVLVVIVTEEGFFRGWLWGSLRRAGFGEMRTLVWSSLAFTAWHFSAVALPTGFDLPPAQIPVYMVNAFVMGAIWGLLRMASGSVIVASVSHGLWNGGAYTLFGFGTKTGALGIEKTWIYGAEVGYVGLLLNILFAFVLLRNVLRAERPRVGAGITLVEP